MKMKISVSSYSFGSYVSRIGYKGVMDEAKKMGFEGIEIVECSELFEDGVIDTVREYSKEIGLPIVAFCVGADFTKNDCTSLDEEIERVKKLVDVAAALGAPKMRHDVCYGNFTKKYGIGFDDVLPIMAKGCLEVTKYAETKGVKTMFENHGNFIQDSDRVEKLINAVSHPNFGYLCDIGNFLCADEDPAHAVGKLAKYAIHAHAKDFHIRSGEKTNPGAGWFPSRSGNYLRGAIIGHGEAYPDKTIDILKNSGYDGYISIEFEGLEDNLTGIAMGLENLKRFIG